MGQKINQRQYGRKYSNEESPTGDVWLDGRPIYMKTISIPTLLNTGELKVAHGISYDFIINIEAMAKSNSGTMFHIPWVQNNAGNNAQISIHIDYTNINITTMSNRNQYPAYVTLFYIKP